LFGAIHDKIEELMDLDVDQAINMFLEKDRVPSEVVVSHLQKNKYYLYLVNYETSIHVLKLLQQPDSVKSWADSHIKV
jgi:hypothetical protein